MKEFRVKKKLAKTVNLSRFRVFVMEKSFKNPAARG